MSLLDRGVEARSTDRVPERVTSAATAAGGRLDSKSVTDSGTERRTRLVIVVPADRLEWTLRELRRYGQLKSERGPGRAGAVQDERDTARRSDGSGMATIEVVIVVRD